MSLRSRRIIGALLISALICASAGCTAPDAARPNRSDPIGTGPVPAYPDRDTFVFSRRFSSSFESVADFAGFYRVPSPHLGTSRQELTDAVTHSGRVAFHATIDGTNPVRSGENTNHRAYPTVQPHRLPEGPYRGQVRVEFWTWLDVDLSGGRDADWFSLATLTSYADDNWYQTQLLNLNSDGLLRLQHVPSAGQSLIDIYQTTTIRFPMRQWVKVTLFVDYTHDNSWNSPYIAAWQDERLVSAARFDGRVNPTTADHSQHPACLRGWNGDSIADAEQRCHLDYRPGSLAQAHFGLYAPPLLARGQIYQDDLEILEAG